MEGETFLKFCVILSNLTPGNAPNWNPGVLEIYKVGLRDIPNSAASMLTEAVIDGCTFRPAVAEIKALYKEITSAGKVTAFGIAAHISELVTRYGRYGQPHPDYKNFYVEGPPAELCAEAHLALLPFGGWVKYCDSADPEGVTRAHLMKFAQAVADGTSSETMQRLQIEYKHMRPAALPAPALVIESREPLLSAPSQNMAHIGAMPLLEMMGVPK